MMLSQLKTDDVSLQDQVTKLQNDMRVLKQAYLNKDQEAKQLHSQVNDYKVKLAEFEKATDKSQLALVQQQKFEIKNLQAQLKQLQLISNKKQNVKETQQVKSPIKSNSDKQIKQYQTQLQEKEEIIQKLQESLKQSDLQKSDIKQPGPKSLKAEELMQKIIQQHEQETSLKDTIIQSLKSNLQQNQTQIQALNTQIQDLKLLANSDQINRQKIYYEGLIQRLNDQIHAQENSLVKSQVEETVQKLKISMQLK
ncbi:Hypothetical_protein [Hexamita inflata]|uniref:Hypothetical_protein n=1 Tax=Hexamita inflata TaxID=28002 RepID=A0AA86P5T0_9EUKA|nr:Hypothetical protein HINF_LOCUS16019 [Hexamita inflata]CAI9931206.1 Hypothetical protein HINF_LOCUS18851 [Hexamita inflata]